MQPNKTTLTLKGRQNKWLRADFSSINGKYHCLDGPAFILTDIDVNTVLEAEYWIHGKKYTKEEFYNYVKGLDSEGDRNLLGDLGQSFD